MKRLSGAQKKVLGLYRSFLRHARVKAETPTERKEMWITVREVSVWKTEDSYGSWKQVLGISKLEKNFFHLFFFCPKAYSGEKFVFEKREKKAVWKKRGASIDRSFVFWERTFCPKTLSL